MEKKAAALLEWYVEMGIEMAVSSNACNHFEFIPQEMGKKASSPVQKKAAVPGSGALQTAVLQQGSKEGEHKVVFSQKGVSSETLARQCKTLEELRAAIETFEGCALKLTATNTVFGDGNPNSPIMFVGEAPGADEDIQGLPFVGTCGQLLSNALRTIGLDRKNLYITNIVPWRPPGNRTPTTQEVSLCLPFVRRHIQLVDPKILVFLGGVSTKALLNTSEGIMKLRGRWFAYEGEDNRPPIRALAMYHPAFLLRSPGQKAQFWKDLLLIQEALEKVT